MQTGDNLNGKIIELLDADLERREDLVEMIRKLSDEYKNEGEICKRIFQILAHLDLEEKEAIRHWNAISRHKSDMENRLGRTVAFRTSLLDYFLTETTLIKAPSIVEFYIYESAKYNIMIDDLTGLYNHRFLREFLWKETKRSLRYHKSFSIVIMDIDNFEEVNANYGYLAGNEILHYVSKVIEANMRIEDIAARYGGDEFVLILPETAGVGALSFCERIKELIESGDVQYSDRTIEVRVSIGYTTYPADHEDPVVLLEYADKALYHAKFLGKGRIVAYSKNDFEI
jgi:diguanylate cyclase (GGDEF)-like protein